MATLTMGQFEALETQKVCRCCEVTYRSKELRSLTPHRGRFGFDVIEFIGRALFVHCHNEATIQADLMIKNIDISKSEVRFLGKRFIVYLALAHWECLDDLKDYMDSKGGYILHMDGTCEDDSPHLFSCIDAISTIVLGNRKMPTENSQHIIPLLYDLKSAYGTPVAMVHDMGSAILKSVAEVFPGVPDYICHFHFLRDIGKDLFDFEYRTIRRYTRSMNVKAALKKAEKALKTRIDDDEALSDKLQAYLDKSRPAVLDNPWLTAYLLVVWIVESNSASQGFGFPFDQPHLDFYERVQEAYPSLKRLKEKGVSELPLMILHRTLADKALKKQVVRIQQKITIFNELREAMRIACPDSKRGLNDEGDGDIQTIECRVKAFRDAEKIKTLSSSDTSYHKMVKQIDKYWDKLFADPIRVGTPTGEVIIQPQRTNNLMEQSFRFLKRDGRKKNGQHALNKALVGMLADTPLVRNLDNNDYMGILLKGKKSLAARFSDIDIQQVREEDKANRKLLRKYPKNMSRLFKIQHLPRKIMKTEST